MKIITKDGSPPLHFRRRVQEAMQL
jgi:hypothetical protein